MKIMGGLTIRTYPQRNRGGCLVLGRPLRRFRRIGLTRVSRGEGRSMADSNDIAGIVIRLLVEGEHALFIMLGADGCINRMGSGEVDNHEHDMFIGKTDPALFQGLRQQIGPKLFNWFGQQRADPHPRGKICELIVGLKHADGKESWTGWRYGSESLGPPPEVRQFVIAAISATDSWSFYSRRRISD